MKKTIVFFMGPLGLGTAPKENEMKKSSRVLFLMIATMIFMAGSLTAAPVILKFSHTDPQDGLRDQAAKFFAQKVKEYTKGRYEVQIFPASQLGNDPKNIEQLNLGGIDFTVSSTGSYAPQLPSLNLAMLPFLVDSYEQGWKLYDESAWLKKQFALAPSKGYRFIGTWEAGFRCLTTKDPVASPVDCQGKKLRSFANPMMKLLLEAMGFAVQIMPINEVYLGIQQGIVQGQENPIDTIYTQKFYEVAPYVTLTRHVYSPIPVTISEITWQILSKEDQAAILKACADAAAFSRKAVKEKEDGQLKEMIAKGAKVSTPDLTSFRKAMEAVYVEAGKIYGDAEVKAFLKDAEAVRKALPVK